MSQNSEVAEAVAIVGMSCRFAPDLDSLDKFWTFLADGKSSVSEMPEKRWKSYASNSPQATAIMRETTRRGSFLDDIEGFDADFFGISPREADFLDPQQRFILELSWEALANAGVPPLSLRGTETGVFVAANSNDYGRRLLEDIGRTGAYAVNGTTYYGIANRLSYFLDLRGPSMAVDTACAGSLTALHVACQSLRSGETPMAIVGGVNIMATPALNVALEAAGAMSPDGRSKAFDKDADGYGRGEGAGVVVLKLLSDALADGDPVQALIMGSGVFQDGRSDGMMAPNADAQVHMLRQAYERAGISPGTVDYIEAHGTGTPVGDGEEASALAEVFGAGRSPDAPCLIGSVKPNVGHIEGGSGITGVIKTVLALQHEQLPPSLHVEPNPDLPWEDAGLRLIGELSQWPASETPRRAGVSSYGVGGSISHVILQDAPAASRGRTAASGTARAIDSTTASAVYPVSAMSAGGLRAMADAVADWLEQHPDASLRSVGHTLSQRRSHLSQRGAVVANSAEQLTERLRALAEERSAPGVHHARTGAGSASDVVWVFSGHGAQWSGMGQQLLRDEPVFAAAIDALGDVFRAEMGWTPREAIVSGGPWTAAHIQALTFAMQIGLAAVWREHGVEPGAIIGHSVGEIAAAVAAGSLDVTDAARFACRRATALQRLEGRGAMALVGLPFDEVRQRLAGRDDVEAAISASPNSTVLSGDRDAVERLSAQWQDDGLDVRRVDTDIAFHSRQVDEVLHEVAAAAAELTPCEPSTPLYSTALTDPRSTAARDADYWTANLRQPVRFAEGVEAAITDGYRHFLEVSSHAVVAHSIIESLEHHDVEDGAVARTLRRDTDDVETILGNLADLHCHGAAIDWTRQHGAGELASLPAAAWQHRPYWIFPEEETDAGIGSGHDPASHSLLGGRMTVSGSPSRMVWQTLLDMDTRPYPLSHEVVGVEITPAASIINTFAAAAAEHNAVPSLSDIVLRTPLSVVPPRVVQIVREDKSLSLATRVVSEDAVDDGDEWITHTTATIDTGASGPSGTVDADDLRARLPEGSWQRVDEMFRTMGVGGYAFPWDLDELRRDGREQLAVMTIVPPPATQATSWAHVIDGALTISAVVVTPEDAPVLWMSRGIEKVTFHGEPPARIVVHSKRSARSPEDTVDVVVADGTGTVVCEVTGLRFAAVEHLGSAAGPRDLVHEVAWRPLAADARAERTTVEHILFVGDPAVTGPLVAQLGHEVTCHQVCNPEPHTHVPHRCGCTVDLGPKLLERPGAIVVAPSLTRDGENLEKSAERAAWTLIRTAQRLSEIQASAGDQVAPQRMWCLTRGVREAHEEASVGHGPLWGISRIIGGEHPELWGGVIDVVNGAGTDAVTGIGATLLDLVRGAPGDEDVIAVRGDDVTVARLTPIERAADGTPLECAPAGTVLITGGLGALGLEVARWLVDRGARRLLLAGRRGLPPRAEWSAVTDPDVRRQIDGVLALEALGVTVGVVSVDITDAEQVAAALDPTTTGLPPVRGVVHAAGVVNDALVDKVDLDGLRDVLAPKVNGAMVLHRLFPPGTLDFFVLFSSCGQFARLTGQTSYAAANSFLDALAAHRNASGHTESTSLGWTSWRGVGLSASIATTMFEANARGLEAISSTEALRAWTFGDRFAGSYQAILRVLPTPPNAPKLPMFRDLTATEDPTGGDAGGQGLALDWDTTPEEEILAQVVADVREQVASELNLAAEDVDLKRPLVELGVDSVMTVALRVRLQRRYGLDLPPTILWAKPTVAALSEHVVDSLRPEAAESGESGEPVDAPEDAAA